MAWTDIAAGEVDANSPLNQTLMGKIKGNLDALHQGMPLLNAHGRFYNSSAWEYVFKAQRDVSNQSTEELFTGVVWIPDGVSELGVRVYGMTEDSPAGGKYFRVTVDSQYCDLSCPDTGDSYGWKGEGSITGFGTGWKPFSVAGKNGSPTQDRMFYVAGLLIRSK